jgi:predicted Zn-ribbon and HTH transcriptional regulator
MPIKPKTPDEWKDAFIKLVEEKNTINIPSELWLLVEDYIAWLKGNSIRTVEEIGFRCYIMPQQVYSVGNKIYISHYDDSPYSHQLNKISVIDDDKIKAIDFDDISNVEANKDIICYVLIDNKIILINTKTDKVKHCINIDINSKLNSHLNGYSSTTNVNGKILVLRHSSCKTSGYIFKNDKEIAQFEIKTIINNFAVIGETFYCIDFNKDESGDYKVFLLAIDLNNGQEIYSCEVGICPNRPSIGNVIMANGKLYIPKRGGLLVVNPKNGDVKKEITIEGAEISNMVFKNNLVYMYVNKNAKTDNFSKNVMVIDPILDEIFYTIVLKGAVCGSGLGVTDKYIYLINFNNPSLWKISHLTYDK